MLYKTGKLKTLKDEAGETGDDLAGVIDVNRTTMSRKMNLKRVFNLNEAKKLADHFNTTVGDLFFYKY